MIAVLVWAAVATADPFPAGNLCIADLPCIATEGRQVQIAPAPQPRRFVWTADDRSVVAIGIIDAVATAIALATGTSRPLRILGSGQSEIAFEIASPSSRWQWTVAKPPPSIRLIHPICPDCVLSAQANGFRKFEKPLRDVRDIVLHPWPHLRGRVVDRETKAALPGATITASGILLAKTDANGAFDAAIEKHWPGVIDVEFPGRAPRRIAVPRVSVDTELPPISMSAGGALRVTIETPVAEKLTWELRDSASGDLLRHGTLAPSATLVVVDGVGEGKQTFVIRGERPLQRLATFVDIHPEQVTEASISIERSTLHLGVKRGATPFAYAKTKVRMVDRWDGELVLDEDGRATEELWQRGKMSALIYRNDRIIYFDDKDVDSEEATWHITVPDRRVIGRVIDATTGAPLHDAQVALSFHAAGKGGMVLANSDADGRFMFDGIDEGTHELEARREGYQSAKEIMVAVGEGEGEYPRDIQLHSRNSGRPLIVTNDQGFPVAGAAVIVAGANGVREVGYTGADGTASVPLGLTERGIVFAIPSSGSFGFTRVAAREHDDGPIAVHIPAPAATIDVETHDRDGKPIAGVLLVPRVDGLMLPIEVVDSLHNLQGVSFFTDAAGRARLSGLPRGTYELWAVTGRDTMRTVRSPAPPPASASLEVVSGLYAVTIGFNPSR
ncbi:MAG TPA: carboxypeptidase regulatory-like domain-containing protein [Thermoanaerobaculia bacterium]|nr:carboxypeptidase regulatory-like domain-containing protein [Thermoanaerobaculia bacterium]